jgi:hypothetical protein
MFSHLRSQDKRAPKFSHLINITHCPFNTSPHKKISCLRSNKFDDKTIFLQFPQVSIHSLSKIQRSNGMVSSYRLISNVISTSFTQQNDAASWYGGVVFLPWCRDCSRSVPTTRSLSRQRKDCIRGLEAYPSCSVTYMSLHLAVPACGSFNWPVTRRELRQPITFEEV